MPSPEKLIQDGGGRRKLRAFCQERRGPEVVENTSQLKHGTRSIITTLGKAAKQAIQINTQKHKEKKRNMCRCIISASAYTGEINNNGSGTSERRRKVPDIAPPFRILYAPAPPPGSRLPPSGAHAHTYARYCPVLYRIFFHVSSVCHVLHAHPPPPSLRTVDYCGAFIVRGNPRYVPHDAKNFNQGGSHLTTETSTGRRSAHVPSVARR